MDDTWAPLKPYACERCGSIDWDSEPKWRPANPDERAAGMVRVPVFSPDRSTCQGCGLVLNFTAVAV